ncbi:MAG: lysozyme inhibitor LprI family protein [Pseudomonadota bacterium]
MRNPILTLVLFTCLPTIALSDPATECGGSSQVEIGDCVADTLERVDGVIDLYFGFAMDAAKELDEVTDRTEAVPALDAAQAAWAAYREAHCAYVGATFGGGSGTAIGINACKIELGRERAKTLRRYVQ